MKELTRLKISILGSGCFTIGFICCALFLIRNDGIINEDEHFFDSMMEISFKEIFINNLMVCVLFVIGCGILTLIMLFLQGVMFGMEFSFWIIMGNSPKLFCLLFVPHVIFEIAAMLMSLYIGFELLYTIYDKSRSFKELLSKEMRHVIIMISFVFIAALVECFITPRIYLMFT